MAHSLSIAGRVNFRSPEEEELERKQVYLANLQVKLGTLEEELRLLADHLASFSRLYTSRVEARMVRLDEVVARVAFMEALLNRDDDAPVERMPTSREQTDESRDDGDEELDEADDNDIPRAIEPSEDLRALFRSAAKEMHPDLSLDPAEREERTEWMASLNAAYQARDAEAVATLLEDWLMRPEPVRGDDVGSRLIRVIRQIAQVEGRCEEIEAEMDELKASGLYALYESSIQAKEEGWDLLESMTSELDQRIEEQMDELTRLLNRFSDEMRQI